MTGKKEEVLTMSAKERYRFIRSEMVRRGITNADISRAAEVSREYVFMVMSSQCKGYRVRQILSAKCGVPVEYLWPDTPVEYRRAA
jgi:lambda repressor-like predicted transcriptional regulator